MDFTALDFETADELTPCELGVCVVRKGKIVETRSWLIKPDCYPYMNPWHQNVHGISSRELDKAPYFDTVWAEAGPYLSDSLLVAHNARFDMTVLRETLCRHGMPIPSVDYLCSVRLSRRMWPEMENHRLDALCRRFGIVFRHHRAGEDAEACARVMLQIAEEIQTRKSVPVRQLSLDIFRPDGMSVREVARELKIKPLKM